MSPAIKTRGHRARLAVAAFAGLVWFGGVHGVWAQTIPPSEYQVKAAFLFHFAQFVEWPAGTYKDAGSQLTYCTLGADPFHGALEASLNEKTVDGRPVRVLHLRQVQEAQGCQVLFIGILQKEHIPKVLASLNGNPVLTVGESEHFAEQGGMIGFRLEDNKVRFEINLGAANRAKLRISARLLSLAKTVIGGPKGT
ncbi:MAG: YfiR family protein [Candidatus Acidiferrum sp.]